MESDIESLKEKFYTIKKKGWIKSCRQDTGGIGITFEKLVGVNTNELEIPDFGEIEIKTKTIGSDSYTTLFNCVPTGPRYHEVERIKDTYGYPDKIIKSKKVLNAIINSKVEVKVGLWYYFRIKVDKEKERIVLIISDKNKNILEQEVYWDFDSLEEKLCRKLNYLAIILAEKKKIDNEKYFKYCQMKVLKLKSFETFIELLEKGVIQISLKLGIYRSGSKIGKIHDRGTAFGIKEENIEQLFEIIDVYM